MKSRAIVLHVLRYNDEQLIVDLLTEEIGCVSMMVRISRSKRAAIKHTLFSPLAILDIEWDNRPKANLQRPKAVQVGIPLVSLSHDVFKMSISMFVAETLHHAVRIEPDWRAIYNYAVRSIQWLDTCKKGYNNFHLVFLLRLTRFLGFIPNIEGALSTDYFDLRSSCFVKSQPPHPDYLTPEYASIIPKLLRMRYETMRFFKFSGSERSKLLEYINTYYRLHIPNFPELKSLAVFKEMFS